MGRFGTRLIPVRRHTAWANRITLAAQAVRPPVPLAGALTARLVFYRTRPKSARRVRWPTTRPDLGNLSKGLLDALEGIVYHDDAQLVELAEAKRFADESPTGQPGVAIFIARAHPDPISAAVRASMGARREAARAPLTPATD